MSHDGARRPNGSLRAGAAMVDITPANLDGLDAMGPGFNAVHDKLFARAVVFDDGASMIGLVSLDVLEYGDATPLLARIEVELGIPTENVMVVSSHAHNAPRAGLTTPGGLARPPSPQSLAFTTALDDGVIAALTNARQNLVPARIGMATGPVDVNVNRDVKVDGTWTLGVNPEGVCDKTLTVLAVQSDHGIVATLLNYAVHSTVTLGLPLLGADLAGATALAVEQRLGGVACWLPGSLGDQAPKWSLEIARRAGLDPSPDEVFRQLDVLAQTLAEQAGYLAGGLGQWESSGPLAGRSLTIDCPAKAGQEQAANMTQDDVATVALRISLLEIGPWLLAGVGGELTTAAADCLRNQLPPDTVLVSLANQRVGYLGGPPDFEADTFPARGCPVAPNWLSMTAALLDESGWLEQTLAGAKWRH